MISFIHNEISRKLCDKTSKRMKDDEGNSRKEFLQKGLNALLANRHFLLLYVPGNGAKMQIVQPAKDPYHRKRMIKMTKESKGVPSFYYTLSHVWRISKDNRHLWHEIGDHVDNEDGKPAEAISMRPEKRATLLALLRDHPDSYWWIDVLCARTDTPLDIMGDIYACCLECIAMIDCDSTVIPKLVTMKDRREDLDEITWADNQRPLKQLIDNHRHLIDVLSTLMQSQWWHRVWTWQEMALPFGDVRLMSETGTHQEPLVNTIAVDDLVESFSKQVEMMDMMDHANGCLTAGSHAVHMWLSDIKESRAFLAHCIKKEKDTRDTKDFCHLMWLLGKSTRQCMDPCDYVYGVLGMLQIKIPRMTVPEAVWRRFLTELDHYMETKGIKNKQNCWARVTQINDRVYQVDLRKANNMADVYKHLL